MDIKTTIQVIEALCALRDQAVMEDDYKAAIQFNRACRKVTRVCFEALEILSDKIAHINQDLQESAEGLKALIDRQ